MSNLLWGFLCAKISLVPDFGYVVILRKCLNAEVKPAGWIFRGEGCNSWRGFFTLSISTTIWSTDFFFFSFDISGDWKLSRNLAIALSLLKLPPRRESQTPTSAMLGCRVKCSDKDTHLLFSLLVWASVSTFYNAPFIGSKALWGIY